MEIHVQDTHRVVTLSLSTEEARDLRNDICAGDAPIGGMSFATRQLLGALGAIAEQREYGGS